MSDLHNPTDPATRAPRYKRAAGGGCWGDRARHHRQPWEKRIDAILMVLSNKGLMTVDGDAEKHRKPGPRRIRPDWATHERWIHAAAQTMIQRGVVTVDELGRKIAEVQGRADAFD